MDKRLQTFKNTHNITTGANLRYLRLACQSSEEPCQLCYMYCVVFNFLITVQSKQAGLKIPEKMMALYHNNTFNSFIRLRY